MSTTVTYEPLAKPSDKRGLALLEEVIDEIESHDFRTWRQTSWVSTPEVLRPDVAETRVPAFDCGTTACLFGHAVFKAGARLFIHPTSFAEGSYVSNDYVWAPKGNVRFISDYAQELFGLNIEMADWLSAGGRLWSEILRFRDAWRDDAAVGPYEAIARLKLMASIDDAVLGEETF